MKVGLCLLFFLAVGFVQAQEPGAQQQADVGPTILSRTDMQVPAQVAREKAGNSFDYFLFSDGYFNFNAPVNSQPSQTSSYGNTAGFDVGGGLDLVHDFHRGSVSLTYSGSWRDYTNSNYYSGFQQGLNFRFTYQLSRHLTLSLLQNIAAAPNGTGAYQFAQNPYAGSNGQAGETRLFLTGGTLTYQQTARLSYVVAGDFFVSQYRPISVNDSLGGQVTASANYRYSKKATVSFAYSYSHFTYSQNSNDVSNNQTGYVTYAYAITPKTQFAVSGGATSAAVTQAILFGAPPVLTTFHSTTTFPYFSGRLGHSARRGSASFQASQSILAGNGALGTSKSLSVTGTVTYSPSLKWALSGTGGYQHLTALGQMQTCSGQTQNCNTYSTGFATLGFSYKLSRHFGLKSNLSYGLFDNYGNGGTQPTGSISFGITFTSGDRPVIFF